MGATLLHHLRTLATWRPQWLLRSSELALCGHERARRSFKILVRHTIITVDRTPYCPACTCNYLERFSTLCAVCLQPILPGESVARGPSTATHPYTHIGKRCCDSLALHCGTWNEGALSPKGERVGKHVVAIHVRGHALNTGQ